MDVSARQQTLDLGADALEPRLSAAELEFLAFHRANPNVYTTLRRLALAVKKRGYTRLSIKMLWEVLRYELLMAEEVVDPDSEYRLNNNYTSRYARLLMASEPGLKNFFHTRTLRT